MKYVTGILFVFICQLAVSQPVFEDHFIPQALRIDFLLAGSADQQTLYIQGMKKEEPWAGPRKNLVNPFGYGNFRVMVRDSLNQKLLYSRGFSTLFEEWQTTGEANQTSRAFSHTIRIPFPRHKMIIQIKKRGDNQLLWEKKVTPDNYFIRDEKPPQAEVKRLHGSGDPARSVDIAFLAEGYTRDEMKKFEEDVRNISDYIFSQKPFSTYRDRFNIYAVQAVSQESGTDVPGEHIYKNTVLNTSYYTFDVPRYLTTFDTRRIRDYAANAPYDHVFLMINTERYGGGGFYNHYSATTSGHYYSKEVAIHEFGHGFAGLGDEYYNSKVAYNEFYNPSQEPWEPNLTTRVDFESKWKNMVDDGVPIPTPRNEQYKDTVGVFEGGGYVAKGVFSPSMDCRMKSNQAEGFCPVCQRAIERMILYYLNER